MGHYELQYVYLYCHPLKSRFNIFRDVINAHIVIFVVPRSLGIAAGVAHGRIVEPPDWVLDYWHPLEKKQYPEYFKKREIRKCDYIQKWHCGIMY